MSPRSTNNSPRWLAGALLTVAGGLVAFGLMAHEHHLPGGAWLGLLGTLAASAGIVALLGMWRPAAGQPGSSWRETSWFPLSDEPAWRAPVYAAPVALALAVSGVVLGVEALPYCLGAALAVLLPAALRRPGLLLLSLFAALHLPLLGAFGLWDPWETHYGEVAREILSRDDWISLWWAQDGWFWSKPVLIFWLEAWSWRALGFDFRPDATFAAIEWAVRLPNFALATAGLMVAYHALKRLFSPRAGLLAGLVLAMTPHFVFMTRQAITDMPFVSTMMAAVGFLMLAVRTDPEVPAAQYRLGRFVVGGPQLAIGCLLLLVVPQILYLVSRNVTLIDGWLFAWHRDELFAGSAGNSGIPGNAAVGRHEAWARSLWAQPVVQAMLWSAGLIGLLWSLRGERRLQPTYMLGFYLCCALSFLAKGLPGFGLPGLIALLYLVASRRFDLLLSGRLRVARGALLIAVAGLPWFVAMYARHGPPFLDRLLVHDHINRLTAGVHGDTGSIQYYVAQLGYGLFPWTLLVPAAFALLLRLGRDGQRSSEAQRDACLVLGLWFAATFTLFSLMTTKFHHYIFPAVVPVAMMIGILLDRVLGPAPDPAGGWRPRMSSVLSYAAPLLLVPAVAGLWGDPRGIVPAGVQDPQGEWVMTHGWPPLLCAALIAVGLGALAYAGRDVARAGAGAATSGVPWLGAAIVCGALIAAFVGRDLSWVTDQRPAGYERLIHLFVYNYKRLWPEHFDYRPILTGFASVAVVAGASMASVRLRALGTRVFMATGVLFAVWCADVYMLDLTPHWSQRDLIERYYRERESNAQPLVAWQMNWKGENLYTGNRVHVFVDLDNKKLRRWLKENEGVQAFFIFEHKRFRSFRRVMDDRSLEQLTTKRDNNKFVLVRARL